VNAVAACINAAINDATIRGVAIFLYSANVPKPVRTLTTPSAAKK
jgi:hypothetical protein